MKYYYIKASVFVLAVGASDELVNLFRIIFARELGYM
jgi:hypothetical protein